MTHVAPAGGAPAPRVLGPAALVVLSAVGFAMMNVLAKVAAREVPALEVACVRAAVGALSLYGWAYFAKRSLVVRNHRAMWLRTLFGTVAMMLTFQSLTTLPLAEATALLNTSPLFVAVLGWFVLRERVSLALGSALAIGFVGVVLLVNPGGGAGIGGLVPLAAALCSALAMVTLRQLGATEAPETVVAHFSAGATVLTALVAGHSFVVPSFGTALVMLAAGATATFSQVLMTRAYAMDRAARIGVGGYVTVLASVLFGLVLFDEPLSWTSAAGVVVVLGAGVLLGADARRTARAV